MSFKEIEHQCEANIIRWRPKAVAARSRVGDWEGDVMRGGRGKTVIVGFLERKTGLFLARKKPDRTAPAMLAAAADTYSSFPNGLCLTITLDNGKENSCHAELESLLGCKVYFADPGCAWQKGCMENTFCLPRQYIPKRTNIADCTAKHLEQFVDAINNRPRKGRATSHQTKPFKKLLLRLTFEFTEKRRRSFGPPRFFHIVGDCLKLLLDKSFSMLLSY